LDELPKNVSLFGLAPRGVCLATLVTKRAGKLLPHRFTHHLAAGLFSVALVVISFHRCPDVIRLVALRCSDFPLSILFDSDYPTYSSARLDDCNKSVEQLQSLFELL
jgi:hypothetical protein